MNFFNINLKDKFNNINNNDMKGSSDIFDIKKRDYKYFNEVENVYRKKRTNLIIPNQYGDRFIPRRYTKMNECQRYFATLQTKSLNINLDIIQLRDISGYWRLHYFEIILNDAFNVHDQDRRVFTLSDASTKNNVSEFFLHSFKLNKKNMHNYDFPCIPRMKPYAFIESSHDLPGSQFVAGSVIGWSPNGKIIASFGRDLVVWLPGTDETIVIGINFVQVVAFNVTGEYMILARHLMKTTKLELWEFATNKRKKAVLVKSDGVTCIEWHRTDDCIVYGSKDTNLYMINSDDLTPLHSFETYHGHDLKTLKFSPNNRYLASLDVNGCILIWRYMFKNLTCYRNLSFFMTVFIDWNPFADDEIVIAESRRVRICILKVNTKKAMAYYYRKDKIFSIDGISFNKVSGEMIVACTINDVINECRTHEVLVLASLNRVVDVLRHHDDLIRVLMWSPDGKQLGILATICDDESLVIWNFLPDINKSDRFGKHVNFNDKKKKTNCNIDVFNYCTGLQIR